MHFITIMGLLWLVSIGVFWGVMKYKPPDIVERFLSFWMLVFSGLLVVTIGFRYSDWIVRHQVLFMALSVLLGVVVLGLLFFHSRSFSPFLSKASAFCLKKDFDGATFCRWRSRSDFLFTSSRFHWLFPARAVRPASWFTGRLAWLSRICSAC